MQKVPFAIVDILADDAKYKQSDSGKARKSTGSRSERGINMKQNPHRMQQIVTAHT